MTDLISEVKGAQKQFWGSNGIRTHDLRDTGAMLYRLSYEASPEGGQVRVQFIPVIWRERREVYMIKIIFNISKSDLCHPKLNY